MSLPARPGLALRRAVCNFSVYGDSEGSSLSMGIAMSDNDTIRLSATRGVAPGKAANRLVALPYT